MDRFEGIDGRRRLDAIKSAMRAVVRETQEINRNLRATDEDVAWMLKQKEEELKNLHRAWSYLTGLGLR